MKTFTQIIAVLAGLALPSLSHAIIYPFDLDGKAGPGLLVGNETGTVTIPFDTPAPAGGEVGDGIFYNSDTNILTINIAWGAANGFADLTGAATAGHIHGMTASSGEAAFFENAGVPSGLGLNTGPGTWNASATSGGFSGTRLFTEEQEVGLMAGRFYINIHTTLNGPGEIRGQLVMVPEPSFFAASLGLAALGWLAWKRR